MELDSNLFLHDADKAEMNALRSIPGFHQVMKVFMKVWNEQLMLPWMLVVMHVLTEIPIPLL